MIIIIVCTGIYVILLTIIDILSQKRPYIYELYGFPLLSAFWTTVAVITAVFYYEQVGIFSTILMLLSAAVIIVYSFKFFNLGKKIRRNYEKTPKEEREEG